MLLGIDTGGTYTDAALYDEATRTVVAKAKSPTTHHELSIGICGAIDAVLALAEVAPERIELVSLSTTLATNALVEGKGRPVGAVIIGFDGDVLERAGLGEALGPDPAVILAGGHDPHGGAVAPLDTERLAVEVAAVASRVEAFAVTAQFSVRNPEHELAAAEVIREVTGKPVTLSHHLSARLNGPKRAVTAVLNARLISIIDGLVRTTEQALLDRGVHAPLMVVRGDGSLVSAAFVRERPIETILSGPAASLVGAAHLTALDDAIISDIGGTTTDIAVLRDGIPAVSPEGARRRAPHHGASGRDAHPRPRWRQPGPARRPTGGRRVAHRAAQGGAAVSVGRGGTGPGARDARRAPHQHDAR
jgi:N-methylhydantoinase A/oxoprolinase/acetone carboxylase beta subunit